MLTTVHLYHDSVPLPLPGKLYAPSIVSNTDDESRWLLVAGWSAIPAALWVNALSRSIDGIVSIRQNDDGSLSYLSMTAEQVTKTASADWAHTPPLGNLRFPTYTFPAVLPTPPTYLTSGATVEAPDDAGQDGARFVHLHTHTEYSALDGLSTVGEAVREVVADGQRALGIADHGTCAGHPAHQRACDAAGINPVFGIEAYLVGDRLERPTPGDLDAQKRLRNDYWHLCLFAQDNQGLSNIWAASTESFRDGFYHRPRMDWSTLERHSEGVIATTGCLRGPLAVALADGDLPAAVERLARLLEIFPDRLYVELQTNGLVKQRELNEMLVELARVYKLPVVACVDAHFATKHDADAHHTWIACQTKKDVQDEGDLFAEDLDLYMQTEAEVRAALSYLPQEVVDEAVANTAAIAARCSARIEGSTTTPVFTRDGTHEDDNRRLRELCEQNWTARVPSGADEQAYRERFEREMELLVNKAFCGYYLMVGDYTGWAKDNGILVGPGRGSGGGSLVAYLARITSLDPLVHGLLFERFLTYGRHGLPDFDVDFPASKKDVILGYLRFRYGEGHVVSIGNEIRLQNKGVINDLARALASQLPEGAAADLRKACIIIDEAEAGTAGLGLSWDDLWAQHGDQLQPFADRYPGLFSMAHRLVNRLKTYGKHAAGVVISTDKPLIDWLPLRSVDGAEQMVTQWAMGDVESLGLVKFDILTLRTLDTIQECLDTIWDQRRISIDLESFDKEFEDPIVWAELMAAHTLGVFQIETTSGTRLCEQMKPRSLPELADMVTIVRPGPKNSGLTDLYLRRRAGQQTVTYPDERLKEILGPTYGAMIFQEQVMAATRILAGYDEEEADAVRKILGKKQVEKIQSAGQEFISRADMPREAAEQLWAQMAEFSKYGFNKSHAYAYAYLAYWTAFLKTHYPLEYMRSALSTVDKERLPDFVKEARRLGVAVLPPDINASRSGFTIDLDAYAVRYGLDSIKGIGAAAVADLTNHQPYTSWEDFETRKGPKANAGTVSLLARIGAFDSLVPNRRGLETRLLARKTGEDATCIFKSEIPGPHQLGCSYDWASEPIPVNPRTGKLLKAKTPPKKCTKACRRYEARPLLQIDTVEQYSDEDIRTIELDMLGTYLSSTPFDRLDPEDRRVCLEQARQVKTGPNGKYIVAALITNIRQHPTLPMGFLALETEGPSLSVAVFSDAWAAERPRMRSKTLCLAQIRKTDRGLNLAAYQPL